MAGVEIRKVETDFHETGQTPTTRTEVEYVLGGEIDGVFVPFATVSADRAAMFKQRSDAAPEQQKPEQPTRSGSESASE